MMRDPHMEALEETKRLELQADVERAQRRLRRAQQRLLESKLTYKGKHASHEILSMVRDVLEAQQDYVVTQEDLDAFAQLTSVMDPLNEAMRGLAHLGNKPKTVAAVFCAMSTEVAQVAYGHRKASDCFCRIDRDPAIKDGWQYDTAVLRFIYDAVMDKLDGFRPLSEPEVLVPEDLCEYMDEDWDEWCQGCNHAIDSPCEVHG